MEGLWAEIIEIPESIVGSHQSQWDLQSCYFSTLCQSNIFKQTAICAEIDNMQNTSGEFTSPLLDQDQGWYDNSAMYIPHE